MPLQNGKNSIIHEANNADLTGYTYTQVYASSSATITLNGTSVDLTAGLVLDILVRSISGTLTNVYLIGDKKSTSNPGGIKGVIL